MVDSLRFGVQHGWKQIIFGHIGRKPEGSLKDVAKRLGELLGQEVALITDWLDEATLDIRPQVTEKIAASASGSVMVLDNTRRYPIERVLWDAKPDDLAQLAPKLAHFANECATKIARVYVNEALSAGSLDTSTTIVPAAMDRMALGTYVAGEFDGPMKRCLATQLVVFSGLKIDKLDDLQAMIDRGTIRWVFAAGSLAMALKKAAAELDGKQFALGLAEQPDQIDKPFYIPRERVAQAERMISQGGRAKGFNLSCQSTSCCKTVKPPTLLDRPISNSTWARKRPNCSRKRLASSFNRPSRRFKPEVLRPSPFTTACSACSKTCDLRWGRSVLCRN